MLTSRAALLASAVRAASRPFHHHNLRAAALSSKSVQTKPEEEDEDALPAITQKRQELRKNNSHQIMGPTGNFFPAPILPEDPSEITALDAADENHRTKMDGTERTVIIRQDKKSTRQAPLNPESVWKINFYEDGIITQKWTNPLMGWQAGSDPYTSAPPLTFTNASDAVYFAKKRGWNYIVKKPITRVMRDDDAQYQDNFLPQAVATRLQMEGTSCDYWKRSNAATSHYFRPLKYHGDGTVPQYGPNGDAQIAPYVEGVAKLR